MRVSLFCQSASEKTRKLHQGKLKLGITKNFFTKGIVKHWNRLPNEAVQLLFLKVFRRGVDVEHHSLVWT